MHEIIGCTSRSLGFVDQRSLQVDDALFGIAQAHTQTLAQFCHFFTGSASGCLQQFFGVGNYDLQIGDQFFLVGQLSRLIGYPYDALKSIHIG